MKYELTCPYCSYVTGELDSKDSAEYLLSLHIGEEHGDKINP